MKVCYLTTGATVHDRRFLVAYADRGYEVVLLRLNPEGELPEGWLPTRVREVHWLPEGTDARDLERLVAPLRAVLDAEEPDVVHAGPLPTCAWLASRTGAPRLVAMSWGSDVLLEAELDADAAARASEAVAAATLVQCDCRHTASVLAARHGADPARTVVFPWGVDLEHFSPAEHPMRPWPDDPGAIVIATFRSWEPVYGVQTAVRAFATAARVDPRLQLVLGGAGSLAADLDEIVRASHVQERVLVPGVVPNAKMRSLLHGADIYLSCSHSDGTSISLLEAMATALPAVVTDIPCNREWIAPGDGGLLAPTGDQAAFADAIVALAADAEARARMGARNRAVAVARADWPRNVEALFTAIGAVTGPATRGT